MARYLRRNEAEEAAAQTAIELAAPEGLTLDEVDACVRPETSLSRDEALVVAGPYFLAVQEEFSRHEQDHYGGRSVLLARVRLECAPWRELADDEGFSVRNFAATSDDGHVIVIAPELVELPEESVVAILGHEFGHAYDNLYPGRWVLADGELLRFDDALAGVGDPELESKANQKARVARARQWRDRTDDEVENTADAIATEVLGHQIRYCGPCVLQCFERTASRRPAGLR